MKRQIFVFSGLFVLFCLLFSFNTDALAAQYKVKKGDSLYSISKKLNVSIDKIKEDNNLQNTAIKPKQILNISSEGSSTSTAKSKSKPVYYTVRKKDTLSKIARKTQLPMKKIMALNHINQKAYELDKNLFWPGQPINQYPISQKKMKLRKMTIIRWPMKMKKISQALTNHPNW